VEMEQTIDAAAERERLGKDLAYYQGFIQSVQKKLSNEKFVAGAPANVIEAERKKLADGEEKLKSLEEALAQLN
jgi:valyl-tRNA synthetase